VRAREAGKLLVEALDRMKVHADVISIYHTIAAEVGRVLSRSYGCPGMDRHIRGTSLFKLAHQRGDLVRLIGVRIE
jgi:hypothetical protein